MSWMILTVSALLVWGAVNDREGPLWRWMVVAPSAWIVAIRPRHLLAIVLFLLIAPLMAELAMSSLALAMAVDIAAWIEVTAAVLIVARLAPGWKALKANLAGAIERLSGQARRAPRRGAARAARRPTVRRPSTRPGPDEDGAPWVFA